jgi:hypothetical protein
VKALVHAEPVTPPAVAAAVHKDTAVAPCPAATDTGVRASEVARPGDASWEESRTPPPTDPLTLCHRLLI